MLSLCVSVQHRKQSFDSIAGGSTREPVFAAAAGMGTAKAGGAKYSEEASSPGGARSVSSDADFRDRRDGDGTGVEAALAAIREELGQMRRLLRVRVTKAAPPPAVTLQYHDPSGIDPSPAVVSSGPAPAGLAQLAQQLGDSLGRTTPLSAGGACGGGSSVDASVLRTVLREELSSVVHEAFTRLSASTASLGGGLAASESPAPSSGASVTVQSLRASAAGRIGSQASVQQPAMNVPPNEGVIAATKLDIEMAARPGNFAPTAGLKRPSARRAGRPLASAPPQPGAVTPPLQFRPLLPWPEADQVISHGGGNTYIMDSLPSKASWSSAPLPRSQGPGGYQGQQPHTPSMRPPSFVPGIEFTEVPTAALRADGSQYTEGPGQNRSNGLRGSVPFRRASGGGGTAGLFGDNPVSGGGGTVSGGFVYDDGPVREAPCPKRR